MEKARVTIEELVNSKYCLSCGMCAIGSPKRYLENDGFYNKPDGILDENAAEYCPISPQVLHNEINYRRSSGDDPIGHFDQAFIGHASRDARTMSSSGGMLRQYLGTSLREGWLDGVVTLYYNEQKEGFHDEVEYRLSTDASEIYKGCKSLYNRLSASECNFKRTTSG